jgi:hypothetical protein
MKDHFPHHYQWQDSQESLHCGWHCQTSPLESPDLLSTLLKNWQCWLTFKCHSRANHHMWTWVGEGSCLVYVASSKEMKISWSIFAQISHKTNMLYYSFPWHKVNIFSNRCLQKLMWWHTHKKDWLTYQIHMLILSTLMFIIVLQPVYR